MTRRKGWLVRAIEPIAASRVGSWYFLHVANPVDRRLLPATNGRLSLAPGQPVLCLEVRGAKSGELRRTPLLYGEQDGGELIIVASAGGASRHPAWYRNVMANPRVKVYAPGGRTGSYEARTAEGEERERLWLKMSKEVYAGYDTYQQRGGREIPIVVLTPVR